MGKVENIERQIKDLSFDALAEKALQAHASGTTSKH